MKKEKTMAQLAYNLPAYSYGGFEKEASLYDIQVHKNICPNGESNV